MKSVLILLVVLCGTIRISRAQHSDSRYLSGTPAASFPIHFTNGFLFASLPVVDTALNGTIDTITRSFLIDPRISNDGTYLPEDSGTTHLGQRTFTIPLPSQRTLILHLAASLIRWNFKIADTAYMGSIGYGFFRQYRTVLDLVYNTISFYPIDNNVKYDPRLGRQSLVVPYYDDAMIPYCHCEFPTIWLDPDISPLNKGRMHFSLADRQSVLYRNALPPSILKKIDDAAIKDSLEGKPPSLSGVTLSHFVLGTEDIVTSDPRRPIDKLPDFFKDLNFPVTGTVAMDVVKKYKGLVIDPTRSVLYFCKY